ncbi:hypothetical protein [Polyangium spumosum]|uniref:Uncharacterized protein n=1 Tax=Polyangium spumosum TaxID=889282 RepID=A0A6N7Q2R4_9BACT|nr:hypothetical protein [Polyangium spumosum]MRG98563.1 hypothetical protein [Polyangium spumosum]
MFLDNRTPIEAPIGLVLVRLDAHGREGREDGRELVLVLFTRAARLDA